MIAGSRSVVVFVLLLAASRGFAQYGLVPLSRSVEAPFATALHQYRSKAHTAVRPYLQSDIAVIPGHDTLAGSALLPVLDRWNGSTHASKFRGGPLLDAALGVSFGENEMLKQRLGAGAWLEYDPVKNLTLHVDGQVWTESFPDYLDSLARATRVTPGEGYAYGDGPNYTHFDLNGYANWHPSKYFHFTLGRGRNSFGEGYRSLFLSDNTYSYPYLKITTTVWHIRYVNLFTQLKDIRGAGDDRNADLKKYASFHYLSWNASKRFNFALFEAIVWQDNDPKYPRGFDVNYLNPIVFYRPVEFAVGSPDNALLGFGMNVKVAEKNTLYFQLMLDEFLMNEVRSGNGWFANKQALQLGVVAYDAFKVPGLVLRQEWNYVRPFMYTHSDTRQNYSHFGQPLAHPYGSNFLEALAIGEYRRDRWNYRALLSMAVMGQDTGEWSWGNNIFRPESDRPPRDSEGRKENYGYYLGDALTKQVIFTELRARYVVDPRSGIALEVGWQFRASMPQAGEDLITNYLRVGIVCRFRDSYPEQDVRYVLP